MKRKVFLVLAYLSLFGLILFLIIDWVLFAIKNPKDAVDYHNWLQLILIPLYFAVGYSLVFVKGWSKIRPAESSWPVPRCLGIILWSVMTVHTLVPLCGRQSVLFHFEACLTCDVLFIIRMIIGKNRKEIGWIWQVYSVLYLWIVPIASTLVVDLIC